MGKTDGLKKGDRYVGLKMTAEEKDILERIAAKEFRHITGQVRYMIMHWENLLDKAKYKDI